MTFYLIAALLEWSLLINKIYYRHKVQIWGNLKLLRQRYFISRSPSLQIRHSINLFLILWNLWGASSSIDKKSKCSKIPLRQHENSVTTVLISRTTSFNISLSKRGLRTSHGLNVLKSFKLSWLFFMTGFYIIIPSLCFIYFSNVTRDF